MIFKGTARDDRFAGGDENDRYKLQQGGDDAVFGGGGFDSFYFGATFNSNDHVDGGAGLDLLGLNGDYSAGITLNAQYVANIEFVNLHGGHDYRVIVKDSAVSGTDKFTINTDHGKHNSTYIDASDVHHGSIFIDGGKGTDTLLGGGVDDNLFGDRGADILTGGQGDTIFRYLRTTDSTPRNYDIVTNFKQGDKIDLSHVDADRAPEVFKHFHLGTESGHQGDLTVTYDGVGHTIIRGYADNDGNPELLISLQGNHANLTAADFILG